MNWAARILLIGVLALAAISLISAAIVFAAPYLAALTVLILVGKALWNALESSPEDN